MAFSCVFYDILFPDGEPLGLIIERHRLTYTVHGRTQTIDCCAVVSSFTSSEVAEGDILININEFPLLNNPALLNAGRDHFEIISKMINEARPPRRIRFLRREAMDGEVVLSDTTVVSLRPDEASLIYDEVQQKEHEERLRVREREKLAAIEREKQRVEEEERRHAEAVERKRREDLELKIIRERQRLEYEEQERRFYEDHPATANLYEIAFPVDQRSFGLTVTARRLTYVKESRKRRTIDCCAVTHSELTAQVKPGDIIIKVNDLPLVSDRTAPTTTEAEQQAYFTSVMQRLQDAPVPRTLMLLRPVLSATFPGTDLATPGLSDQLLLYLSRSEEATIFETPTDRTDRLAREAGGLRSRSESNASVPVPLAGMMMSPSTPPRRALPSANLPTFDSLLGSSLIGPGAGAGAGLRGVLHSSLSPMSTGTYMTEEEEIAKRAEERILQLKRQMGLLPAAPPAATPSSSYGGAAGSLGGLSEEEEIQRRVEDEVRRRFEAELKVIDADHLLRPAAGGGPSASASTRAGESAEEEIQRVADAMVKKRVEEEMRRVQDDRVRVATITYICCIPPVLTRVGMLLPPPGGPPLQARQMEEEVRRRVSEEAKRLEAQQRRELEHKMREIEEYKKAVVEVRSQENPCARRAGP